MNSAAHAQAMRGALLEAVERKVNFKPHAKTPDGITLDHLGLIPIWVYEWRTVLGDKDVITLKNFLRECYRHSSGTPELYEFSDATIEDDGTYKSKGDEDLYPLASIDTQAGTFYQYDYGICAIPQKEGAYFVTRMD